MILIRPAIIVIACILTGSGCASSGNNASDADSNHRYSRPGINRTPEDLARRTIESFKRSNIVLFANSAFTVSDAEMMVRRIQNSFPPGQFPVPFNRGLESWDYGEIFYGWSEIWLAGKHKLGIDWTKIRFERAECKYIGEAYGITAGDIDAIFSVDGKIYRILIDDCYLTDRGWLAADNPVWRGEVEK